MVGAYRALTGILEWVSRPALALIGRGHEEEREARSGRLPNVRGGIWIHAASAGEVRGIVPLAERLGGGTTRPLLVTAHTAAGLAGARRHLPHARTARAPFDFPGSMRRAMAGVDPAGIILAETELWPNLILAAQAAGVPISIVNGRISDRTIGRYLALRSLTRPLLERFTAIATQSPEDAARFVSLGAPEARVRVTGNMKHDMPAAAAAPAALPWSDGPLVVAGSLREGEEEIVAEALRIVSRTVPGLRIVAAPRHRHRGPAVGRAFHYRGFRTSLRSEGGPRSGDNVLVLDTMGELLGFYARASVAFVGGTLLPFGGHNLVEPAALGIPVVHGPFVANCRLEAEALARNGASAQGPTLDSLVKAFEWFLTDPVAHARASEAGRRTVLELSGATDRTIEFLRERGAWPA